jgi:HlyD family secretion protein
MNNILNRVKSFLKKSVFWFKKASLPKKVFVIIGSGLLVYFLIGRLGGNDAGVSYQEEAVEMGTIVNIVSETGEIATTGKTDVSSAITGIVGEVYIDNGGQIKRGQNLFKVTSTATEEERTKAYADYLSAKATLGTAKANQYAYQADMFQEWDEFKELAESDEYDEDHIENRNLPEYHIPEKEWLASEVKYKNQAQVVSQAQVAVTNKWLAYQTTIDGVVKSPASGTIANLAVAPGQYVDTDSTALIVKSGHQAWVKLAVNETDVLTLKPGQPATVLVDALKDEEFEGLVERVDEFGTVEAGVVTYNVYLSLSNLSGSVKPGMTVQVDIETEKKENVLVIPNSAIKPYQGGRAVQVINERTGQLLYLPIEVGIVGPTKSEVVSGLKEGQEIIVGQTDNDERNQRGGGFFPPH